MDDGADELMGEAIRQAVLAGGMRHFAMMDDDLAVRLTRAAERHSQASAEAVEAWLAQVQSRPDNVVVLADWRG